MAGKIHLILNAFAYNYVSFH